MRLLPRMGPARLFLPLALLGLQPGCRSPGTAPAGPSGTQLRFEKVTLTEGGPPCTIDLLGTLRGPGRAPVILLLGSLSADSPPAWAQELLEAGFVLAAFSVDHPPDPDPERRPVWLHFDERFAHSYVLGGERAPRDTRRVIDHLAARGDLATERLGWLGSSSTGILGLSVLCEEPRIRAFVGFVSTGAYRDWLESWKRNGLWQGKTQNLWPETETLLPRVDPILKVDRLAQRPLLLVSGGLDKVVDPDTARRFVEAARPHYAAEAERLRLVVYEGFGHNLPPDVVALHATSWFRRFLGTPAPEGAPAPPPATLEESTRRTQLNSTSHRDVLGATPPGGQK